MTPTTFHIKSTSGRPTETHSQTRDLSGERLDKALATILPTLSRTQWKRLIQDGDVTVDGMAVKPSHTLNGGEEVRAELPELKPPTMEPEDIPLDIRYEDGDMIAVNKPAGMVVHPGTGHYSGTLANAVLHHCPDLAGVGGEMRPGIVHRLDKNTSGIMVVAKHDQALRHLQRQFKQRTVGKKYKALVEGQIQPPVALIDAPIGRDPTHRKKMTVIVPGSARYQSARARPAQTHYRTLRTYDRFTLLECTLHTGRTHQIRVHLAYLNYPVVGDRIYGRRRRKFGLRRHFLHAAELTLKRPSDEKEMTFTAELPSELEEVLALLEAA